MYPPVSGVVSPNTWCVPALADKHEGVGGKQAATDAFQLLSEAFKVMVANGAAKGR